MLVCVSHSFIFQRLIYMLCIYAPLFSEIPMFYSILHNLYNLSSLNWETALIDKVVIAIVTYNIFNITTTVSIGNRTE